MYKLKQPLPVDVVLIKGNLLTLIVRFCLQDRRQMNVKWQTVIKQMRRDLLSVYLFSLEPNGVHSRRAAGIYCHRVAGVINSYLVRCQRSSMELKMCHRWEDIGSGKTTENLIILYKSPYFRYYWQTIKGFRVVMWIDVIALVVCSFEKARSFPRRSEQSS